MGESLSSPEQAAGSPPNAAPAAAVRRPVRRVALFRLVTLVLVFAFVELFSRGAIYYLDHVRRKELPPLNSYQLADPNIPGLWRLRPGFTQTVAEFLEGKQQTGRLLAVKHYQESATRLKLPPEATLLRINGDGYRGPEVDHAHRHVRILTLGDSCTFGTIDSYTYPDGLRKSLEERGLEAEVINGGVEGYTPRTVLQRIEEFKALRPEVTIIYLGWNAMYSDPTVEPGPLARYVYTFKLVGRLYRRFGRGNAMASYMKQKSADPNAEAVRALDDYNPAYLKEVEKIAQEMRSAGSEVVVCTLPGLFVLDETPSQRALEIGHLPDSTDNPYVLAKMTQRYNELLRQVAGREGYQVADLEAWGRQALQPRDEYFFDGVHLWEEGQVKIGRYLADELAPQVQKKAASRSAQ